MIVLVIDDQISVVSGIISGINWGEIGVTKVLKAYNAFEAKNIVRTQPVDIMLCDIEMPAEDGISLFRWVKDNNYNIECIFLTSHADFIYAKEALRLGSFDYILQPARYEDIQDAVRRAIERVKSKEEYQQYFSYGKLWFEKRDFLLDSILKDWFLGKRVSYDKLRSDIKKLDIPMEPGGTFYFSIIQILSWEKENRGKNDELFRYGVTNILSEMFEYYGQKVLLVQTGADTYSFINFSVRDTVMDMEAVKHQTEEFIRICGGHFGCRIACYTGPAIHMEELTDRVAELQKLKEDNVAMADRVIVLGDEPERKEKAWKIQSLKRWSGLLAEGEGKSARKEIFDYLDSQAKYNLLDAESLQRFYQEFMRMLFLVLERLGLTMDDIFSDQQTLKKFLGSYSSLNEMKIMIDYAITSLEQVSGLSQSTESQIEKIVQYIHDNIEKDIRRSELAEAVYLSPDYISHLFSRKMCMPLSEFVMKEKMKVAQTLLTTTSLPVNVVAVKVGYSNFSYFSKTYKRIMGQSPAGDRKADETVKNRTGK